MSEAITKACNAYRCDGGICKYTEMPWATCSKCKGTGRVPDVKAALRAEVARLKEDLARKDAAFDAHVAVTNQISANAIRLTDDNARLTAENAALRAEVERLTTHVDGLIEVNRINLDMAKSQEAAHLSLMQTTAAYYEAEVARLTAENARLAAEVERLAGCKS